MANGINKHFDDLFEKALAEATTTKASRGGKVGVQSIVYTYAEGVPAEKAPFLKRPYPTWAAANQAARKMAFYAPKTGGYDKTDFTVTWTDGETYEGRLDLQYDNTTGRPLTEHIIEFLSFMGGVRKPAHLSKEQYRDVLDRYEKGTPGQQAAMRKFLHDYDFGETSPLLPVTAPASTTRQVEEEKQLRAKAQHKATLATYPPPPTGRADAILRIRKALKERSGKSWSVTGSTGTSYGWITISSPPKRAGQYGYMNEADRVELAKLLDLDRPVHHQGQSIAPDSRTAYVDMAEGRKPRDSR